VTKQSPLGVQALSRLDHRRLCRCPHPPPAACCALCTPCTARAAAPCLGVGGRPVVVVVVDL